MLELLSPTSGTTLNSEMRRLHRVGIDIFTLLHLKYSVNRAGLLKGFPSSGQQYQSAMVNDPYAEAVHAHGTCAPRVPTKTEYSD